MTFETKTLWHNAKDNSSIICTELSKSTGEVIIKSLFSLISLGTERLVAKGEVPKSMYTAMKVPHMQGDFSFPLTYGYSVVGKVIDGPATMLNKNVHLLHPHQSMIKTTPDVCSIIPSGIPPKRAVLASNLETAINAVWDSGVSIGDKILVVGYGLIGALICEILSNIMGVDVVSLESDPNRQTLAKNNGLDAISTDQATARKFDIAINTSANQNGLQSCINAVGYEGVIVELSWYGEKSVNINLGHDFHHLRKRIISSQVSTIPVQKRGGWDFERRKNLVFKLLQSSVFDTMLDHEIKFDTSPDYFDQLRSKKLDHFSTIINY